MPTRGVFGFNTYRCQPACMHIAVHFSHHTLANATCYALIVYILQDIPIVIAGNKLDLASTHREVTIEDVSEWVYCELPKLR